MVSLYPSFRIKHFKSEKVYKFFKLLPYLTFILIIYKSLYQSPYYFLIGTNYIFSSLSIKGGSKQKF